MAGWGWAEITGQSASPNPSQSQLIIEDGSPDDSDTPGRSDSQVAVPQPDEDATNKDDEPQQVPSDTQMAKRLSQSETSGATSGTSALEGIRNFLGLTAKTTKKDLKMYKRSQTIKMGAERANSVSTEDTSSTQEPSSNQPQVASRRPLATRGDTIIEDPTNSNAPPKTSIFESAGDILNPPIPPTSWIIDPSSRTRTVFHDRVYHPEDIPPPPMKRPRTGRSISGTQGSTATPSALSEEALTPDLSGMRVEERIARAYHKDLSWRKVLVRLEPDAHNNMIVRRMFANAYGWPVVKHLCDTHFGDTYAALTRDEEEPATDRAKGIHKPVGEEGEHVKGQESITPPPRPEGEMREAADELKPLKSPQSTLSAQGTPARVGTASSMESFDSRIFDDDTDDEDNRGLIQKFWPQSPKLGGQTSKRSSTQEPTTKTDIDDFLTVSKASASNAEPEIADFLTSTPPALEEDKSFDAAVQPGKDFMEIGLRKSAEDMVSRPNSSSGSGEHATSVSEQVARSLGPRTKVKDGDEAQ